MLELFNVELLKYILHINIFAFVNYFLFLLSLKNKINNKY